MDRDQFLTRVRSAMETADLPEVPGGAPGGLVPDLSTDGLLDRFSARVQAVDGSVHVVADDDEATGVAAGLLEQYEATEYLAWDPEHLPVAALLDRLPGTRLDATVANTASDRIDHQTGYMDLRAGITGAVAGLAESGSIVLDCGPGRSRMASLIPLAHIALIREPDIVPSLSHWIAAHPRAVAATSNLVVVTGPSRTADIEQVLNLGVHGPKFLDVIVLASS